MTLARAVEKHMEVEDDNVSHSSGHGGGGADEAGATPTPAAPSPAAPAQPPATQQLPVAAASHLLITQDMFDEMMNRAQGNRPAGNNPANPANPTVGDGQGGGAGGFRIPNVPTPQKFSGDDGYELSVAMFHFENYLVGNRIPRDRWAFYAQYLLTGTAAKLYTVHAQGLGRSPTWEDVRAALQVFDKPQEARKAALDLLDLRQTKSVADYIKNFDMLRAKSGNKSAEEDLINLFQKGLKDQEGTAAHPVTGDWWKSLDELKRFAATREATLGTKAKGGQDTAQRGGLGIRKQFAFKRPVAKLKAAFVHTQAKHNGAKGYNKNAPKAGARPRADGEGPSYKRSRAEPGNNTAPAGKREHCQYCSAIRGVPFAHVGGTDACTEKDKAQPYLQKLMRRSN